MARKRGRRRRSLVGAVAVTGTLCTAAAEAWWALGFFWLSAALAWMAFCVHTVCDVENKSDGRPCGNNAYGKLLSCHLRSHRRAKLDALFAVIGQENPGRRYRVMWARTPMEHGRVSPAPQEGEARAIRPMYDISMLVATVGSFALAAVAFMVQT